MVRQAGRLTDGQTDDQTEKQTYQMLLKTTKSKIHTSHSSGHVAWQYRQSFFFYSLKERKINKIHHIYVKDTLYQNQWMHFGAEWKKKIQNKLNKHQQI